jgi:ketosteroid isomerase-like protein
MSQENVEAFKRGVEAWDRDDFDAWLDHLDPEFEWFALMEVFRGHAGARQAWESFKGNLHLRARLTMFVTSGNRYSRLGNSWARDRQPG